MANDFISFEEMEKLERSGKAETAIPQMKPEEYKSRDFVSFDEMSEHEKSGAAKAHKRGPQTSASQTALESYGDTMTMGYLSQAQAGAEGGIDYIMRALGEAGLGPKAIDAALRAEGFNIEGSEYDFLKSRDANTARREIQQEEHPTAHKIGVGAGIVNSLAIPGGGAKNIKTMAGRLKNAAKMGGLYGAAQNPGDIEGEYAGMQLGDRLENAAIGVGSGVVFGGAVEGVMKGGKKVADELRERAARRATRALGRPTPTQMAKLQETGDDVAIGEILLDEGAVPILGTSGRIQKRVDKLTDKAGEEVGELIKSTGDAKVLDATDLAVRVLDDPEIASLRTTPGMEGVYDRVSKMMDTLAANGQMTLEHAQALRQQIDKSIKFTKKSSELRGNEAVLYKIRSVIRDRMNDAINELETAKGGGAGTNKLKTANTRYSKLAKAQELTEREAARNMTNEGVSLTTHLSGGFGGMIGGEVGGKVGSMVGAGLGSGLNAVRQSMGSAMIARTYNAASKLAASSPVMAKMAQENPKQFMMLVTRLVDRTQGGPERKEAPEAPMLKNPLLMKRFQENPALVEGIKNEKLKAAIKAKLGVPAATGTPAHRVSEEEAQQEFLKGN